MVAFSALVADRTAPEFLSALAVAKTANAVRGNECHAERVGGRSLPYMMYDVVSPVVAATKGGTTVRSGNVGERSSLASRLDCLEGPLKEVCDAGPLTDTCLELIARARAELDAGDTGEAQDCILQAECLLLRADKSRETLRRWGPLIGLYEVVLLLALLTLALNGSIHGFVAGAGGGGWTPPAAYMVWGGLGGVVAALFGLYRHAAARDFDRGYVAYYFLKPILGIVLGPLVYLFARAGLMALQSDGGAVERHELLYLGAFVLGFGERFSLRLIDRVAAAMFGPTAMQEARATGPAPGIVRERLGGGAPALLRPTVAAGSIRVEVRGPHLDEMFDVSATLLREEEVIEAKGPPPDEDAVFIFGDLGPGGYQVLVSKPGWEQPTPSTVELQHGEDTAAVEIELVRSEAGDREEGTGPVE